MLKGKEERHKLVKGSQGFLQHDRGWHNYDEVSLPQLTCFMVDLGWVMAHYAKASPWHVALGLMSASMVFS